MADAGKRYFQLMDVSAQRPWKRTNAIIIAGLVVLVLYYLGVRPTETFSPIRQVDFQYWYQIPPLIFQKLEYPSLLPQGWHEHLASWHVNYAYPPSAVALMLPLYAFPRPVAFGIWLVVQAMCFFAVLLLSIRLACLTGWRSRWLIASGAASSLRTQLAGTFAITTSISFTLPLCLPAAALS
jgi:hypothetical protein